MAIVQTIEVSGVPDVFSLLSSDNMRSLSDSIARGTEIKFGNLFGVSYDHAAERNILLNSVRRNNQFVAEVIDSGLHRSFTPDNIICIDTREKLLLGIPKRMEEIIITSPILRKALQRDEIYGFGIDPKTLPVNDPYRKLLRNGGTSASGVVTSICSSHDEPLTIDEMIDIEDTRDFMESLYNEGIDPTDFPFKVGKIK